MAPGELTMNSKSESKDLLFDRPMVTGSQPLSRRRHTLLSPFVCSVLAAGGIFGGISSLFTGLICVVIHSFLRGDHAFDSVGTVLLIIAIPMILAGSVFLDQMGEK